MINRILKIINLIIFFWDWNKFGLNNRGFKFKKKGQSSEFNKCMLIFFLRKKKKI